MRHLASPEFRKAYHALPATVRDLADKSFVLLKAGPDHPSLHFKRMNRFRSARVGLYYRALGVEIEGGILWFWIGSHADYDKLLR